jgi:hypothetical protein
VVEEVWEVVLWVVDLVVLVAAVVWAVVPVAVGKNNKVLKKLNSHDKN